MGEEVTTGVEKVEKVKVEEKTPQDVESQIKTAMRSRVAHFKEQADSLTFEGVRRLLEKDLGMETYALDVHKRFIKQCLVECLESSDDDNVSKNSCETEERTVCSARGEAAESSDGLQLEKDVKEPKSEDEKMEDSPVFGLLTGNKASKPKVEAHQGIEDKGMPDENMIQKALMKRVSYLRVNSQKITMAEVRRLLEQDLELDRNSLDPYKKLISELVEKILESPKAALVSHEKSSRKSSKESSGSSNNDGEEDEEEDSSNTDGEEEEEEVKPKKRITPKGKVSEGLKKRQWQEETKVPRKKQKKQVRAGSEKNNDSEDGGIISEDGGDLRSSVEKQKKEAAAPAYGKRVEHLKSVIKSCGMSVPPSIYRRVKQAPENKREAHLIKELGEILAKEGLSTNPSEKEINEVKRKKERARELEGIHTSNIVSTSRRRSTTTFVAPPIPKITEESDEEDESDDESDNEDDDDDGIEDNGEDEGDDESQSEDNEGEDIKSALVLFVIH
ncbi:Histone chaperone domain CHZ, partial [Dillenia turbinata]